MALCIEKMTTIKLKNSVIANKVPLAGDLVLGEVALNANSTSPALYFKDNADNIIELKPGSSVGNGNTPPPNGNETGDLWWDGDFLLVWNGSDWEVVGGVTSVNGETGDVVLDLGDLNDVNLSLGVSNGDIIAWNGTAWVNTAAPPADISGSSINDLNDVDTTGADDGDILVWNEAAGEWQATDRGTVPENTSDLNNDGENGTDPFITEADVTNILNGNNIDGTPNPGADEYLQAGDNVSELNNDAGYITDAGVTKIIAGDSIEITPTEGTGEVKIDVAIDASGVVINLDDLDDVTVPSPDAGDVLAYDGAEWVSAAAPPADISGSSINQLNDVDAAGANDGDMLIWQTDNWTNTPAPTKTSDLTNDGNGSAGEPFITEGEVTNILNGLNPDGTPDAGAQGYLKPGDNISELNNDKNYITDTDTAADSDKLCGEDCDYYLNYQNATNTPDLDALDYLKPGDNISELNNDKNYITNTDTAADSNKLCGEDCGYYLDYQNATNTPDLDALDYLKPGDNISELNNDKNYITDTDTAADSSKLCGEDCDYYLDYQNTTNTPDLDALAYIPDADWSKYNDAVETVDTDLFILNRGNTLYTIKGSEIGGGAGKPIEPLPGDGNNSITPTPPGSGTDSSPYILTPKEIKNGEVVYTDETISFTNQKPGALVQFTDQNTSSNDARYAQPVGLVGADGTWTGKLQFIDSPESIGDTVFDGLLKIGSNSIYYQWTVQVTLPTEIAQPAVVTPPNGAGVTPGDAYFPQSSDITTATNEVEDGAWKNAGGKQSCWGVYGGGYYFLASGNNSDSGSHKYQYSTDGTSFTEVNASGTNGRLASIAYGNGYLVMAASSTSGGSTLNRSETKAI